jgi:hypothetical protein
MNILHKPVIWIVAGPLNIGLGPLLCRLYWRIGEIVRMRSLGILLFVLLSACSNLASTEAAESLEDAVAQARVYLVNPKNLGKVRARVRTKDPRFTPAYQLLIKDAEAALKAPLLSVTQKTQLPPSGDIHDFYSLAPYYWPNPNTQDGLPWVSRDGEINPESRSISDARAMQQMSDWVKTLAWAFYFSRDERYGKKAAQMLRTWFLNSNTRMNPHLRYAQVRPGTLELHNGIVAGAILIEVVDALGLLESSANWTENDHIAIKKWLSEYLDWLLGSPQGIQESQASNNRGNWYIAQVVIIALRVGKPLLAEGWLVEALNRIPSQIQPDGQQPAELKRVQAIHYSAYNLEALYALAAMAERREIDLWMAHNTRLSVGLDFVLAYGTGQPWGNTVQTIEPSRLMPLLGQAWQAYRDPSYQSQRQALPGTAQHRSSLLHPGF